MSDVVVVAVKPDVVPAVLREIAPHLREDALVVSIAAGIPLAVLEQVNELRAKRFGRATLRWAIHFVLMWRRKGFRFGQDRPFMAAVLLCLLWWHTFCQISRVSFPRVRPWVGLEDIFCHSLT